MQQAEGLQNHHSLNIRDIGQGEEQRRKYEI
jgi:hypothetical protein